MVGDWCVQGSFDWNTGVDEDSDTELLGLETIATTTLTALAQESKRNVAGRHPDKDPGLRPIPAHLNSLRRRQWQHDMQRESDAGAHVIIAINAFASAVQEIAPATVSGQLCTTMLHWVKCDNDVPYVYPHCGLVLSQSA